MFKDPRTKRTAHTKQKPRPRLVTKAHRLERDEQDSAMAAATHSSAGKKAKKTTKN